MLPRPLILSGTSAEAATGGVRELAANISRSGRGRSARSLTMAVMSTSMNLDALEAALVRAETARSTLEAFTARYEGFGLEAAYDLGARLIARRVANGWRRAGFKIGFTNQRRWQQLGLDQPIWAPIYRETVHERRSFAVGHFVQPRIEPEIAFGFRSAVERGAGAADVAAAVSWVAPAFEIVECHFVDWAIRPADAVADAGVHAALVLGNRAPVSPEGAAALAEVEVELRADGKALARGSGRDVLGGPIEAVAWLLRSLPDGEMVRADDIVTTGTLTDALSVRPGQRWSVHFRGPIAVVDHEVRLT